MKHKKTLLTSLMMALLSVMCLFVFSACDALTGVLDSIGLGSLFGTNYAVTWTVDKNATVSVEGYDELPTKVAEGTKLTFTAEGKNGYDIDQVLFGKSKKSPDSQGKYSVTVTGDCEITVTTERAIESVVVTKNPTNMNYYAGDEINTEGMEVTVNYKTNESEVVTNYTVKYQNATEGFAIGDTGFMVSYKSVDSALVTFAEPIVAKIVIDPYGGTIADEYYTALQANDEIENLAKDENGVISFTHAAALTAEIALPTAGQIKKIENGSNFPFLGWTGKIEAGNATSLKVTATYQPSLLVIKSLSYELRNNVPYLVIKGEFDAAESAYLYLYEGNDKVELKGTEVTGTKGESFELLFDAHEIVEAEYLGKWMDIKFRSQFGDRVETQEINLNDYADVEGFVDTASYIRYDGYQYGFAVYTPADTTDRYLKAVASTYFDNTFTVSSKTDADNNVILVFTGKIGVSQYYGKAVYIDFWINSTIGAYGAIDAEGNYVVELNTADFPLETTGYAHFKIVESVDDSTELFKDGSDGNLLNSWCVNDNLNEEYNGIGIITGGAIRCANTNESRTFYLGAGQWGGFVVFGRNEDTSAPTIEVTNKNALTIVTEGNKAYLVIEGTYANMTEDQLKEAAKVDFEDGANVMPKVEMTADKYVWTINADEGTFVLKVDLTDLSVGYYWVHAFKGYNGTNGDVSNSDGLAPITCGNKTYSYEAHQYDWGTGMNLYVKEVAAE